MNERQKKQYKKRLKRIQKIRDTVYDHFLAVGNLQDNTLSELCGILKCQETELVNALNNEINKLSRGVTP